MMWFMAELKSMKISLTYLYLIQHIVKGYGDVVLCRSVSLTEWGVDRLCSFWKPGFEAGWNAAL